MLIAGSAQAFDPPEITPTPVTIAHNIELLADSRTGVIADEQIQITRGWLDAAAYDPAPTATLEVVGRVTGAVQGSWTVSVHQDFLGLGPAMGSVSLNSTHATFAVRSAPIPWPIPGSLDVIKLTRNGAAGTLDLRKVTIRLVQDGVVRATHSRFPLATATAGITGVSWTDLTDAAP